MKDPTLFRLIYVLEYTVGELNGDENTLDGGVTFVGETADGHKIVMDGAPEAAVAIWARDPWKHYCWGWEGVLPMMLFLFYENRDRIFRIAR